MSRIGKQPVELPSGVEASVSGQTVSVKGPKGTRAFTATDDVTIRLDEGRLVVEPRGKSKRARQQWGMSRTQVANVVAGVSQGFRKELEIQGVGYRADMKGSTLNLQLGFSHPIDYEPPEGVSIQTPDQTTIVIEGADKQAVGQAAAVIRGYRPPEPYKGKGIRYQGEHVRRKAGKTAGA